MHTGTRIHRVPNAIQRFPFRPESRSASSHPVRFATRFRNVLARFSYTNGLPYPACVLSLSVCETRRFYARASMREKKPSRKKRGKRKIRATEPWWQTLYGTYKRLDSAKLWFLGSRKNVYYLP